MLEVYKKNKDLKVINKIKKISHQPFSSLILDFCECFSKELRKQAEIYENSDLLHLVLWTRKKKIEHEKKYILKTDKQELVRVYYFTYVHQMYQQILYIHSFLVY